MTEYARLIKKGSLRRPRKKIWAKRRKLVRVKKVAPYQAVHRTLSFSYPPCEMPKSTSSVRSKYAQNTATTAVQPEPVQADFMAWDKS